MLWSALKSQFNFQSGTEEKVKKWALKKMAEQFQSYKKKLYTNFVKKGLTPNFDDDTYKKLRGHWDSFFQYRPTKDAMQAQARNKINASKKSLFHTMGPGGYKKVIPKVHQMEQALLDRGIRPSSLDWPERPKNWFFGHGGSLDENGSLVFPSNL